MILYLKIKNKHIETGNLLVLIIIRKKHVYLPYLDPISLNTGNHDLFIKLRPRKCHLLLLTTDITIKRTPAI